MASTALSVHHENKKFPDEYFWEVQLKWFEQNQLTQKFFEDATIVSI